MARNKHKQLLYKATDRLKTPIIGFHKITPKKDNAFHLTASVFLVENLP